MITVQNVAQIVLGAGLGFMLTGRSTQHVLNVEKNLGFVVIVFG